MNERYKFAIGFYMISVVLASWGGVNSIYLGFVFLGMVLWGLVEYHVSKKEEAKNDSKEKDK